MQPQQQMVVTDAGPVVQPVYVSQPYQTASVVDSYRRRQSTIIGVLLIVAGCLSIVFNIVDIAVGESWIRYYVTYSSYYPYTYRHGYRSDLSETSNGASGHGIWCSAMVITAGGFGIGAGRHKTRCMISTFLVLAIMGAVFAGIQVIVASAGAVSVTDNYIDQDYSNWEVWTVFSMEILLAILGGCAFGLCLWGSILCCASGGGCCAPQPVVFTMQMMPVEQPQVTIVSQQQQPMQPVVMAQPPAYQPPLVYPTPPQIPAGYEYKHV